MRLIDADEFKRQIAGMAIVNNYSADKANKMCELIDIQPTAYDVDKVAFRLECESINCHIMTDRAVEIVKSGKCMGGGSIMSWKFVFNGSNFKNHKDASIAAGKAGYRFFLHNGTVYFRDEISARISDTGLTESDLL